MASQSDPVPGGGAPDLWQQLESLIDGLERRMRAGVGEAEAIRLVLESAVQRIGCRWSAVIQGDASNVWKEADSGLRATAQGDGRLSVAGIDGARDVIKRHAETLKLTADGRGGAISILANSDQGSACLFWRGIGPEQQPIAWLALCFDITPDARTRQAIAEISWVLAGLLAERLILSESQRLQAAAEDSRAFATWTQNTFSLDRTDLLRSAAMLVADRAGADRVWLLEKNAVGRVSVLAVSDARQWDRRSDWVRQVIAAASQPRPTSASAIGDLDSSVVWHEAEGWLPTERVWIARDSGTAAAAPKTTSTHNSSQASATAVRGTRPEWIWVLENDQWQGSDARAQRWGLLCSIRSYLEPELACRRSAFARLIGGRGAASDARSYQRWFILASLLILVVAGAWPVPLRVVAIGELQPTRQRNVFAPDDGRVQSIKVSEAAAVVEGEPLLELVSDPIRQQLAEIKGKIETHEAEISSLRARLAGINILDAAQAAQAEQLRARAALLETERDGLRSEQTILEERASRLRVTSPMSGVVLTRDLEKKLSDRPVKRGQSLLVIADREGSWEAHAVIDVSEMSPLIGLLSRLPTQNSSSAATDLSQLPPGSVIATSHVDPSLSWPISQIKISGSALFDQQANAQVPLQARVEGQIPPQIRPGSQITLRVDCGRQPLAYVLFRKLIEGGRRDGWW